MVAKCNITLNTLQYLNKLLWGVDCDNSIKAIIENYIEYLACDTINIVPCFAEDCTNNTIDVDCTSKSLYRIDNLKNPYPCIYLFVNDEDIVNGKPPYTYQWSYIVSDLIPRGEINKSFIVLCPVANKLRENLVTPITITIIDSEGCRFTKTCYLTPEYLNPPNFGSLECNNYIPCTNISNLSVQLKVTQQCSNNENLTVSKKK